MYRQDHIKVLKALGSEVPKKPKLKVSEIVAISFRRIENADRRVRNAMRKLRSDGLVTIGDRGEYCLLQSGVKWVQEANKNGWPTGNQKTKTTKKVAKKVAKKAPKKVAKKVAKKAPKKAAKKETKAKKPAKAKPQKVEDTVSVNETPKNGAASQLSF